MSVLAKREELVALKERKAKERQARELEERLLLDELDDMEPRPRQPGAAKVHLSKDRDVRQMQIEYERNRERRRLQGDPGRVRRGRHTRRNAHTRNSDSSLSMHLPSENDPPRYNPNADPKLKQLAENHGRNMEYLGNRNRDLERQRDEIRRRLEELGRRPIKGDDSTAALLQELREQEARNQRLLEELRRQLMEARGPINIIQQSEERRPGKSFSYPIYYGNSLVAEISAIRQAYLQNGGADPDILAQMSQMQAEAQAIEDAMRSAQLKTKSKDKRDPGIHSLTTLELENERLQRELLLLQEQNIISKNRRKDDREGRARVTLYEHGLQPSHQPDHPHLLPPRSSPATLAYLPSHPHLHRSNTFSDSYLLSNSYPGYYGGGIGESMQHPTQPLYSQAGQDRFSDREWWMLQKTYRPAPIDRPSSAPTIPKLTIRELDPGEDTNGNPPVTAQPSQELDGKRDTRAKPAVSEATSAGPSRGAPDAQEYHGGPDAPEVDGLDNASEQTALERRGRRDEATRSLWQTIPEGETIIPDDGEAADWYQDFERALENNNWSGKRPRPPTKRVPRPPPRAEPAPSKKK